MSQAKQQKYVPAGVPRDAASLPAYLTDELTRLASYLNSTPQMQGVFIAVHAAPDKVVDGEFLLADGTDWNPAGTGKWFVYWDAVSSSWKSLNDAANLLYSNGDTVQSNYINGVSSNKITGDSILDGAIGTLAIASGSITSALIADLAVISAKLADGAVTQVKLALDSVGTAQLVNAAITAAKLAASSVTASALATASVNAAALASGAVTATAISPGSVTTPAIAANAIVAGLIAAGAVETTALAAGAVTTSAIAANAIVAGLIAAGAVETAALAAGAVTTAKLAAGAVVASTISVGSLDAISAVLGSVTAGEISASVIAPGGLLVDCGGGLTTTFVITSTDNKTFYRAKQGTAGAITLDLGTYYGPTHGTGYYSGRFAFQCMDVSIDFQIDGDWGDVTAKVDVQYDAGAWQNIYIFKTDCDYRGGASGSLIYTTKNTAWGTMAVRVTTDGNTQSASGRVTVINLAASTQTPDTVHNTTGNTSDPGVVRTLDNVPNGTTYGKALAARLNAGKPWIDFSESIHANKNLDNLADGATYGRPLGSRLSAGKPLIDFSEGIHLNKNASNIPYGSGASIESLKPTAAGATPNPFGTQNIVPNPAPRFSGDTYGWCTDSANETINSSMYASPSPYAGIAGYYALSYVNNGRVFASYDGIHVANFQCEAGEPFFVSANLAPSYASDIRIYLLFRRADGSTSTVLPYAQSATVTGDWPTATITGTIPSDCAYYNVMVWGTVAGTSGHGTYFTNVVVAHGSRALTKAGSSIQLGDNRNLSPNNAAGYATAYWSGISITPHPTSLAVSSGTLYVDGNGISYGSSSVSGLANSTTYQLYYQDGSYAGGSQTLHQTTSASVLTANKANIYIGTGTTQSSGGTGGSGGSGACVAAFMFLHPGRKAKVAHPGDKLDCADNFELLLNRKAIETIQFWTEPCVRLVADNGCALVCSVSTPFTIEDGSSVLAPDMQGKKVLTDDGVATISSVTDAGTQQVMKISCNGLSYAAGEDGAHRIYSHNMIKQ